MGRTRTGGRWVVHLHDETDALLEAIRRREQRRSKRPIVRRLIQARAHELGVVAESVRLPPPHDGGPTNQTG